MYLKKIYRILPIAILLIWLTAIGMLIWHRVCESPQPPFHDALSYLQKAKSFWDNVSQGWPHNPLNLVQAVRPPGTVLLSYPFGFSSDYRGFLFRSVFVPFLIWVIAILISCLPNGKNVTLKSTWHSVFVVFILGPMPFFFQFECRAETSYWGVMDGFLASLSALTVACSARSLLYKSWVWAVIAAALAAFCPLVKPSGSIVLLLTTIFWSGNALLSIFYSDSKSRKSSIRFWLSGTTVFLLFGGTISLMCLHSQYLSNEVISYYKQSMVILQNEQNQSLSYLTIKHTLHFLFGPQLFITVFLIAYILSKKLNNYRYQYSDWTFISASILFLLVGGWFWIVTTGISQSRYFFPFALMLIVPFIFVVFRKINFGEITIPTYTAWGIRILCLLPAINLLLLLMFQNPNKKWQKISGVSLNIGLGATGVKFAKDFLKELEIIKKTPSVYSFGNSEDFYSFYCYGWYHNIVNPTSPYFNTVIPVDWQRPSTYRIPEIIKADYVIFAPVTKRKQKQIQSVKQINSLEEEGRVFEAFLSTLTLEDGLKTKFENQFCRLSEITNRHRLKEAFDLFIKTKTWRSVFVEENKIASALDAKSFPVSIELKKANREITNYFEYINILENKLTILGWGFIKGLNSDSMKSYILLKSKDSLSVFSANIQIRKDVTEYFKGNGINYDSTGFSVQIPVYNLEKGHYQVGLYIEKGDQTGIVYSDKYIDVDN